MKKSILLAAPALVLASCASDAIVDEHIGGYTGKTDAPISFITNQKNITRAKNLQETGHYNFGVFAYKSTEEVNNIMDNYLVGYNGTNVGYYMTTGNQTTLGDQPGLENGASQWQYEKLGNTEYDYTGGEGYYTKDQNAYMSNVDKQYLRYWDLSAPTTTFYAYAPYINGATATATYDNSTKTLTIPDGSIEAAYDNYTDHEYMYAVNEVPSSEYGKDVPLNFKRLNAKVNIKFWEDIDGYSVRILDLSSSYAGVQAVPATRTGTAPNYTYAKDKYFEKSGVSIKFTGETAAVNWAAGTTTQAPLKFAAPADAEIGTTRLLASPSATTYYAIPKDKESGFTFHVTYELTSTTGEKIVVNNATVFVPETVCDWNANTHYTYIFKITSNTNGSTAGEDPANPSIDPTDPDVPVEPSLYPIIFDNCTVEDWIESESDHVITDDTDPVYYSLSLDKTTVKAAEGGTVTATLKEEGSPVASPVGTYTVSGPDATKVTCTAAGVVTVAVGAKTGIYTVTYTETASGNHSGTYTADFYVIGQYGVTNSTAEVGTGGVNATQFTVTVSEAGAAITPESTKLSIVYPAGLTGDQKNKVHFINATTVQVESDAITGDYKVAYTTDEGTAYAPFAVKNYGLTLSTGLVGLSQDDQNVTITAGGGGVIALDGPTGFADVELATDGSKVTVKPTATVGTYTITNTVTKGTSVTVYEKTFTVKNVYKLTLSKSLIDNDDNDAARTITIKASTNALDETSLTNVTMTDPNGAAVALPTSGTSYVVPANGVLGTYTVKYNGEVATFILQD